MQEENLAILRALKQNVEELVKPVEAAQREVYGEDQESLQNGLDLVISDLSTEFEN